MSNERKLRLIQVAKEFKVGLNTITDFLQKKGIKTDGSPNTLVEPDVYAVLEKEFGGSRITGNERESIRERISQKQATITLEEAQKQTREEEQEVIIKSNVISVKDELPQPKILGKIDLSPKPKPAPKPVSKPAAEPVPEAAAPKPQPAPQPAAPKTEAAPASETASAAKPEPEAAPKSDNIFRPAVQTLTGPQVLGTMDVSGFTPGNRHKRKRLSKEKVDVTRTPAGSPKPGSNGKSAAQPGRGQGPQSNQPRPGENKKTRKDKLKAPKPVVRPEISDEEVSKQVKDTLARLTSKNAKSKGSKYRKEKREAVAERMNEEFQREEQERSILKVTEFVTVAELATMMNVSATEVITACMNLGLMVSINQRLDAEALVVVAEEFGFKTEFVSADIQEAIGDDEQDSEEDLVPRPPIVTVMGHVDHGKTSLLDNIRKTNVIEGEAGGITQHIGAYTVNVGDRKITFLDTPGHEAFTAMRMRGANATDIAILVVAADDGVMPQTVEAINHAKAAGVEIIVAVNKIDKPSANIDRVKQELAEYELIPEDWGGSTVFAPVSAKSGEGIDQLLDMILLTADIMELKANPKRKARGLVIEAELDKGRGPVATVLVQKGTLHVGDFISAGVAHGKVRAMIDDKGRRVKEAGPSTPVEILGLSDVPSAGEVFLAHDNDKTAKSYAETYLAQNKEKMLEETKGRMSLDDLFSQIQEGNLKELNLIVKADVQGSVEAVKQSLMKLSNEEVVVKCIHGGVGAINESDVSLASASNAIIIGFNVRPDATAKATAEREGVDVRLYKVIYQAIEDIEAAMKGMLDPVYEEKVIGHAEVRQIFKASAIGNIAGSYVLDGVFQRGCKVRITREGEQIFEGNLASLKRFKDDVKEVKAGYECGLVFEGFDKMQELDIVEAYIMVEVPR